MDALYSSVSLLFDQYKDEDDLIGAEGTEKLCNDLDVDPSDVVTIVLSWHMKCPTMCEFTRRGFSEGCRELGVESIEQLKAAIPKMREELQDPVKGKQIYQFTFNFAKVENQKSLALETAIAFWDLLLADRFPHLELWKDFLVKKHGKAITKDTWNLGNYADHDTENGATM
ncbi:hypothetical protein HDV03_004872 [Kappamyces sp. JEL0829]|nr:hypothetical protein HDV03_004872 [Kappamyces sp. JEL0829]